MSKTSWLRNWRTDSKRAPAKTPGRSSRRRLLLLERLEDRCLLTAGFLDPTFDGDGIVTTNVGQPAYGGEQVNAVAIQPDGKIIAVGVTSTGTFKSGTNKQDTAVVRYNTDGSLDNSFSGDGKTTTSFGPNIESTATDVAVQYDGKLVVAGHTGFGSGDFAVVRYNTNGSLDTKFGRGLGMVTTTISKNSADYASAIELQPDGKIVLAGYTRTENPITVDLALVRYNPDGSLDTTFSGDGKVTKHFSSSISAPAMAIYASSSPNGNAGKILVAAGAMVVRYNLNGDLDPTFGDAGTPGYVTLSDVVSAGSVTIQANDEYIVVTTSTGRVARLQSNGSLDPTFGSAGVTQTLLPNFDRYSHYSMAIQPDGKIVVGWNQYFANDLTQNKFAVARFNTNGSLDDGLANDSTPGASFGDKGIGTSTGVIVPVFGGMALQTDGKIVMGGRAGLNATDFVLERFLGDDPPAALLAASAPERAVEQTLSQAYGKLPLSFEANQGQTDTQVNFLSRGDGYTLFLTPGEAVLSLGKGETNDVVRMRVVGADPGATSAGLQEQAGRTNYLLGDDPSQWQTDVANYGKVEYQDVYAGIDLVYYGNQRRLEYDFVVAPGANPNVIQLAFDGVRSMKLDAAGNLILHTAGGDLVKDAPVVYQEVGGARHVIPSRYLLDDGQVRFEVGAYDRALPLVIDPILSYSTYLGGSGIDVSFAIAVDGAGGAYVTGTAGSSSFPTKNAMQSKLKGGNDAFITKFNAAGSGLVYSTYLGGSGSDRGYGIAVDGAGNAYVTGHTVSSNFPTKNPFQTQNAGNLDSFVAKLNAGGSALLYSTYFGGAGGENFNTAWRTGGIAVDGAGNAYITGKTNSLDLLTTTNAVTNAVQPAFGGGDFDAFVAKFDPDPDVDRNGDTIVDGKDSLVYATYFGGSGDEESTGIAVDSAGNAYLTGWTGSSNFKTPNGFQTTRSGYSDAFVTKLNSTGSALLYSTFLGGSGNEFAGGIALDTSGNAYVTGRTSAPTATPAQPADFPTMNAFQATYGGGLSDAFVTKLNPNLAGAASLVYSSYLGGSGDDNPNDNRGAIAVDASGNAYVTGVTYSTNFPTVNAIQGTPGGDYDAFVTKVSAAGSALLYSSYLGGSGDDRGFGIAVSTISGNTFAYVTGLTVSSNFPTVNAFQPRRAGGEFPWDAFVTKISFGPALVATSSVPALSGGTTATPLTSPQVQPVFDEPIGHWQTAGEDSSVLHGSDVRIANLGVRPREMPHDHAALVDQLFSQSGDHQTDSWLGALLDERLNGRRPWFKRRR